MGSKSRSQRRPKRKFQNLPSHASQSSSQLDKENYPSRPCKRTKKDLEEELRSTQQLLGTTRSALVDTQNRLSTTADTLTATEHILTEANTSLLSALDENNNLYRLLRVERRKTQRYRLDKTALAIQLKESSASLASLNKSFTLSLIECDQALEKTLRAEATLQRLQTQTDFEIAKYKQIIGESKKKAKVLQMRNLRSARSRAVAQDKARTAAKMTKKVPWTLVQNGKYTADVKAMARALHKAGCSQGKVGEMIQYVAQKAGFLVAHKMSRRTVQRALIEGGIAAKIQLAYEISQADAVTASGDATSLRGHNYESSHVMITKNGEHKNRILGISSTVDHTSETQVNNWKRLVATITDLFRRCPLAQRSAFSFELANFLRLLKGMNGDHASDQKKTVRLMIEWKKEVSRILLGWDEIHAMDPAEILVIVADICVQNVAEAGGEDVWKALPDSEKDTLAKSSMDALALRLGQAAFEKLSEEDKREIDLFFWAGCSMHKELNSCKAFTDGMESYYIANDIEGPVLLANKDNDATIQLSQDTGLSTAAVQRALKVSERGAVKLIGLLGAFVNHKDPKKGCHDVYDDYFRPFIGNGVRFPGVNNTRYQSFGLGGARIISFLDEHKLFMSFVKNKKQKRTLNHLEQNIVKGMNCPKTIAEIIAFVLYCMAVTHPYALRVRGLGTEKLNILTLGPFHVQVKDHICKLIASPELLLSSAPDAHGDATLDGTPWSDPTAHAACMKLLPTHPDVKPLLLAGLRSSLECWERFTSEFEEGGAIDLASDAEKDLAFMASTNDANEGLLGQWRRFSRESPSSTVAHFEDQAMFSRNETQAFMDEHLASEADQDFLRREARARDESGIEKARRAELTAHAQKAVDEQLAKDAKNTEKERINAARLAAIGLKLDTVEINTMNNDALKDQLNIHRRRGDKEVPIAASPLEVQGRSIGSVVGSSG